jgi:hypothetical protein
MLPATKIKENWDKFNEYITLYISEPRASKLKEFYKKYETRFALMPASHRPQYHNCFPGGYVDHVIRVIECSLLLHEAWRKMGAKNTYTEEELVFAALNHDLGKFGSEDEAAYIPQTEKWKIDKGEMYMFNDKLEYMPVPDRSLYLLTSNGISFTKNEMLGIKLHDGLYDESNKPYLITFNPETKPRTSMVYILHHADMMASRIEFEREQTHLYK